MKLRYRGKSAVGAPGCSARSCKGELGFSHPDKSGVRLLCTSKVKVELIHVSERKMDLGHTSQSRAGPAHIQARRPTGTESLAGLTSPWAARVLLLFTAFLLFLPSTVDNLLMSQWDPLRPQWHAAAAPTVPSATKQNILRCSASISCALVHLNTAWVRLQGRLNVAQNISIHPHCLSKPLQCPVPTS